MMIDARRNRVKGSQLGVRKTVKRACPLSLAVSKAFATVGRILVTSIQSTGCVVIFDLMSNYTRRYCSCTYVSPA